MIPHHNFPKMPARKKMDPSDEGRRSDERNRPVAIEAFEQEHMGLAAKE